MLIVGGSVPVKAAEPLDFERALVGVRNGEVAAVEQIITQPGWVNGFNAYGITPLAVACGAGRSDVVTRLIESGADVNSPLPGDESALMWACRQGDLSTVGQLLHAAAEINHQAKSRQTPLMWAAAAGHADVVRLLIQGGADIDEQLNSGFNAMLLAVREGRSAVVDALLSAGVDVNAVVSPSKSSPRGLREGTSALLVAVENGHFDLAMRLVAAGADPNDQRSSFAPLHAISWVRKTGRGDNPQGDPPPRGSGTRSSLQLVRDLVAAGADVNLPLRRGKGGRATVSPRGATPIFFAARTADGPLIELLLELGADPTIPNFDGATTLTVAAGVGVRSVDEEPGTEDEVVAVVARFLDLGLDVNSIDKNGETAMHGAAYRNYPRVVELLHRSGAVATTWDRKNDSGWTPVKIAQGYRPGSFKPNPPTIAALLAAGGRLPGSSSGPPSD